MGALMISMNFRDCWGLSSEGLPSHSRSCADAFSNRSYLFFCPSRCIIYTGVNSTRDKRVIALPARTKETLDWWHGETPFNNPDDLIFYGMAADKPSNVKTVADLFPETIKRLNEAAVKESRPRRSRPKAASV